MSAAERRVLASLMFVAVMIVGTQRAAGVRRTLTVSDVVNGRR